MGRAMGLGFCLSLLFFMDHNIAGAIVNSADNRYLSKSTGSICSTTATSRTSGVWALRRGHTGPENL